VLSVNLPHSPCAKDEVYLNANSCLPFDEIISVLTLKGVIGKEVGSEVS